MRCKALGRFSSSMKDGSGDRKLAAQQLAGQPVAVDGWSVDSGASEVQFTFSVKDWYCEGWEERFHEI